MPAIALPNGQAPKTATPARTQQAAKQVALSRFTLGAMEHIEPAADVTLSIGQTSQSIDVPASGFLRHLQLLLTLTTAGNGAAVTFKADAPWNIIEEIVLLDVNGTPLITPLSGYDLYLINRYGGYDFDPRWEQNEVYFATTGAGATGGSARFSLKIPVEILGRDALGALANQSSAAQFRWRIKIGATADIYGVAPTTPGTARVQAWINTWTVPPALDVARNAPFEAVPPFHGVTQAWSKQIINTAAGQQNPRFTQVGNLIRNIICVTRDSTQARVATSFPDPYNLELNGVPLHNAASALLLRANTAAKYGNAIGSGTNASPADIGVYVFQYTDDFDGHPGGELRDQYLRTQQGSRLELRGTFGAGAAAGTLTVLTNDLRVPAHVGNIQG